MKFKDLFATKNVSRLLMTAIILFLFLPLIFPEKNDFKIIKKESVYTHEESPLPVFPKENLLDKYVNRLKKFYKMDIPVFTSNEQNVTETPDIKLFSVRNVPEMKSTVDAKTEENGNDTTIEAEDLFFSTDYEDEYTSTNVINYKSVPTNENTSTNSQKGTVVTIDGMLLKPTRNGYYYNDKFYKNGTYPPNADKKNIEGALGRYHSRIAKNLGKKALYYADEQGNLMVSYVNHLPDGIPTDIDTYLATNKRFSPKNTTTRNHAYRTNNQYNRYQGDLTNPDDNATLSDIAIASIRDMHSAYNLFRIKTQNGEITHGINITKPLHESVVNTFLNSNNATSNEITPNKPNTPSLPPPNPEYGNTILAGDQDFAQNYADKIHELNCGTGGPESVSLPSTPEPALIPAIGNIYDMGSGTAVCDLAPLIVEPSSLITNTIPQQSDFDKFKEDLNTITSQNKRTDINIISTDRNFYPVASKLNEEGSIKNSHDEPVTVHIIGPNEEEEDLSKVLEDVTYTITDDLSAADKLTEDLSNYYALTQYENTDTHTMLAFPTKDETKVFILADPNNSYWINNSQQLAGLPIQYMEKNGVYYKGIIVDKTRIGDLVNTEKTNLLYISDQQYKHYLPNGSTLMTVKEDEVNINSLHPEQIQRNAEIVRTLTQQGQETLQKNQNKQQQPIKLIDLEKGTKLIQPQR